MVNEDKTLENKIRRMIHNLIVTYPGASFNNIRDIFELTDSNLRYHLNYLEKNGKISSGVENNIRCYYPHPSSVKVLMNIPETIETYKLTPQQERILNIIIQYPGINQKEIINKSGLNRLKVTRDLHTLKKLKKINNKKYQNNVYYEYVPDAEMKLTILKGLIIKFLQNDIDEETFLRLKKKLE